MTRESSFPIDDAILARWSPRAFDRRAITQAQLMHLFEAARWAPSCYNSQPWRFIYAVREGSDWEKLLSILDPFNRDWAQHAGALVVVAAKRTMTTKPGQSSVLSPSYAFDAGAACSMLALEATRQGLHTHVMAGISCERAVHLLRVPDDCEVLVAIAIGGIGDPASLPDGLRARELPSGRQGLEQIAFEGEFAG